MAENAYLSRLKQLRDQKVESNEKKVQPMLNRPLTRNAPTPGMGPGPAQPQEEQGPDMSSMFGKNIESFSNEDKRFGEFFQEYTKLAEGLRQEVQEGFMPMPIAQQRLQSYINDSAGYFSKNKASAMDNPQVAAMVEGLMAQGMQQEQGGQEAPPAQATMPQQGGM